MFHYTVHPQFLRTAISSISLADKILEIWLINGIKHESFIYFLNSLQPNTETLEGETILCYPGH